MDSLVYSDFPVEELAQMSMDDLIFYLSHLPGSSAELVGSVLAEKEIASRKEAEQFGGSKYVSGNEHLPRVTMTMTPEEQAEAAVIYRKWFVGDPAEPARVPGTSNRSALVAAHVAARRDQENALATPLPKGQARSLVGVTGFPRHSSAAPWDQLTPILLEEMYMRKVSTGRSLMCRVIAPCTTLYSVQTVVEDIEGATYDLSIYNYPTAFDAPPAYADRLFPKDAVLLIREPTFMPSQQGTNPLVRVDSPTDIIVLAPHSALVPEAYFDTSPQTKPPGPLEALGSDEYWRTHGNDLFKQSHWFPAAVAYSRGLALKPDSLVLLLNRAEAYLRLGFFSGALCDVLAVLSSESAELTPAHRGKALLRAARAEYGRRNYARAMDFFRQHKDTGGRNSEDAIWIRKCDDRLKESATGVYNWARLFQESQRESKLDVGEYTGPVEVQEIPGRGRGLVATRDIAPGELLIVSKAISIIDSQDLTDDAWRTALHVRTAQFMTRAQCANVTRLAQTVYGNPDVYQQVLHLYAGPDYPLPPATFPPPRGEPVPVEPLRPTVDIDIMRLEEVVMHSSFDYPRVRPTGADPLETMDARRAPNAVHLVPSLLNHSCVGNARARAFGDVLAVRAVARIRAGAEVTIPYVAPERPYAERAEALKRYLGDARCGCALCEMDRADGEEALRRRDELVAELPASALFQEPLERLEGWAAALDATHARGRGALRPALARVLHGLGEKLRKDARTQRAALEANVRGLACQGFVMADRQWGAAPAGQLKRRRTEELPVEVDDLSMCVDVERAVVGMLRIVQQYRAEDNLAQARRWLRAALKVESIEFGGDKEMFVQKEATLLDGFGLRRFAQSTL